ncbi:MAG: hypothetical protein BROFUL_01997 [Candidatus Brocadia fulgida]|uniref:Uncharacterized protein n=1 Tax=Candidatus Brocadia fulgida TaxID=380242 RepID=A0A0M2UT96_9BACT|nr:MAG: hypothetical protein BROFUL_01997 [Candidatus Brocadia fulgida]
MPTFISLRRDSTTNCISLQQIYSIDKGWEKDSFSEEVFVKSILIGIAHGESALSGFEALTGLRIPGMKHHTTGKYLCSVFLKYHLATPYQSFAGLKSPNDRGHCPPIHYLLNASGMLVEGLLKFQINTPTRLRHPYLKRRRN